MKRNIHYLVAVFMMLVFLLGCTGPKSETVVEKEPDSSEQSGSPTATPPLIAIKFLTQNMQLLPGGGLWGRVVPTLNPVGSSTTAEKLLTAPEKNLYNLSTYPNLSELIHLSKHPSKPGQVQV